MDLPGGCCLYKIVGEKGPGGRRGGDRDLSGWWGCQVRRIGWGGGRIDARSTWWVDRCGRGMPAPCRIGPEPRDIIKIMTATCGCGVQLTGECGLGRQERGQGVPVGGRVRRERQGGQSAPRVPCRSIHEARATIDGCDRAPSSALSRSYDKLIPPSRKYKTVKTVRLTYLVV